MVCKYVDGEYCPLCEFSLGGKLTGKRVDEILEYKGYMYRISGVLIYECHRCGESFMDEVEMKRTAPEIRDFHRRVDSGELK